MSIKSSVHIRVIPQDRDRGYMLLVGYDAKVVRATAAQIITLSAVSRISLNATIERVKQSYNASEVIDSTADNIKKQLAILFGEAVEKPKKEKKAA